MGVALGDRYPRRLEHTMVVIRHRGEEAVTAYDFLPRDPTSPITAATLLSGGGVPGELRARPLRRLPSRRCWKVGDATPGLGAGLVPQRWLGGDLADDTAGDAAGVDAAAMWFQEEYDSTLSLRSNSCRQHTAAMAAFLTGVKDVKLP